MKESCSKLLKTSGLYDQQFTNFDEYLEKGFFKSEVIPADFKAIVNIITTGDYLKSLFEEFLISQFNISLPQKTILEALVFSQKESMTQKELSAFVFTSKGNLSSLLERMEKKELIKRIVHKENKREKRVKITPRGKELFEKVLVTLENSSSTNLLDQDEALQIHDILQEVKKRAGGMLQ